MLKKIQIALCVLIGIGIVVFFVAMITNVNVVPAVPKWLSPAAFGSFGLMVVCCLGVVVTSGHGSRAQAEASRKSSRKREEIAEEPIGDEHLVDEHAGEKCSRAMPMKSRFMTPESTNPLQSSI